MADGTHSILEVAHVMHTLTHLVADTVAINLILHKPD